MLIKTILNRTEKFKSFIYGKAYWSERGGAVSLIIELQARKNGQGKCAVCGKPCSRYDKQPGRYFEHVPLWGMRVFFHYAPRRVRCKQHGIHIEQMPWAEGKEHMTKSYRSFLARWAKRLSWKEVADVFKSKRSSNYILV